MQQLNNRYGRNGCNMVSAVLILAAGLTLAVGNAVAFDKTIFRKINIPAIESVTIGEVGVKRAYSDKSIKCGDFVLSKEEVTGFLSKAGQLTNSEVGFDWSPCMVLGDVTFKNGQKASWSINQSRGGVLELNNGSMLWIYCHDCQAKRFNPNK